MRPKNKYLESGLQLTYKFCKSEDKDFTLVHELVLRLKIKTKPYATSFVGKFCSNQMHKTLYQKQLPGVRGKILRVLLWASFVFGVYSYILYNHSVE